MYNHNLCSLVVSDREFTVTPSNMCGNSLYLKLYEGHSRSNQHKKKPPVSDFAEIPGVGWDYGESNLYLFVAPKVAWLPSYKSLN